MSAVTAAADRPALATEEQLAADRLLIDILADPRVVAAQAGLRAELAADPSANTPDGRAWLDRAVSLYAGSLAMREIGADPRRPVVLRDLEPSVLEWFGMRVPARGTSGESPDNIYRYLSLDGDYSYVLTGRMPTDGPIHFSLDARQASGRKPPGHPAPAGRSDSGVQVGLLTERELACDGRGDFAITIDSRPADGRRNHLRIQPGPVTVLVRNVLSDWRQRPTPLAIRRTDAGAGAPPPSLDALVGNLVDDLREWALYWFNIPHTLLGAPPVNTFPTPVPRDGGWGRLTLCHFRLAEDEAMVVTTSRAGARYTGAQVLGPWLVPPEPAGRSVSRNISQTHANPDGSVTYVLSAVDVGAPNWLDTLDLRQGTAMFRWSAFAGEHDPAILVRDHRVVRLGELDVLLADGPPRVSARDRQAELSRRIGDYAARTAG
ncbi:hypothetical protein [Phenylobacterium sp.]|uniref:hypothetical protein n=1 Tax=Phenylobacterium sp. TaxID=1871053 RepID=UPI00301B8AFB